MDEVGRYSCSSFLLLGKFALSVVVDRCFPIWEGRDGILREPCGFPCYLKGYGYYRGVFVIREDASEVPRG